MCAYCGLGVAGDEVEVLTASSVQRYGVRVTKAVLGGAEDEFVEGILSNEHGHGVFQLFIGGVVYTPGSLALARGPDAHLKGAAMAEAVAREAGYRTEPPPEWGQGR